MTHYPAWIDGEQGTYGVSFPDLLGIVAMGTTVDEALMHAEEALRDYVIEAERAGEAITPPSAIERVETPAGHTLNRHPIDSSVGPERTRQSHARRGGRSVHRRRSSAARHDPYGLRGSGWRDASPKLANDITTPDGNPPPPLKPVPDSRPQPQSRGPCVLRSRSEHRAECFLGAFAAGDPQREPGLLSFSEGCRRIAPTGDKRWMMHRPGSNAGRCPASVSGCWRAPSSATSRPTTSTCISTSWFLSVNSQLVEWA